MTEAADAEGRVPVMLSTTATLYAAPKTLSVEVEGFIVGSLRYGLYDGGTRILSADLERLQTARMHLQRGMGLPFGLLAGFWMRGLVGCLIHGHERLRLKQAAETVREIQKPSKQPAGRASFRAHACYVK